MMKSFTVLLLAFVVLAMDAQAQFSWKKISPNFEDGAVGSYAINPKNSRTIYFSKVSEGGIYRTHNGGVTWDSIANVMSEVTGGRLGRVLRLFISPHDTSLIVAASDQTGTIFRSSDAGMHWHKALDTMGSINSESIFFHPTIPGLVLLAAGVNTPVEYNMPTARIMRSTDYGKSWMNIVWWRTDTIYSNEALFYMSFFCGMTMNQRTGDIFLGGSNGRILRSSDLGLTWNFQYKPSEPPFNFPDKANFRMSKTPTIRFSKQKPHIGFATYFKNPEFGYSKSALMKTTDYGLSWHIHSFFDSSNFTDTTLWAMDVIDAGGNVEVALMTFGWSGQDGFLGYSKNEGASFSFFQNPTWTPSFYNFPNKMEFLPRTPENKGRNIIYCEQTGIWVIDMDAPVSAEDEEPAITTAQVTYSNGALHLHGTSGEQSISLYDVMGKSIGTFSTNTSTVEVGDLPKGVYVCTVSSGSVQQSSKFIVY